MVDAAFQGKGYGSSILAKVVAEIAAKPDENKILVCYHSGNSVARKLYKRFGFIELSTDEDGKTTAILKPPGR